MAPRGQWIGALLVSLTAIACASAVTSEKASLEPASTRPSAVRSAKPVSPEPGAELSAPVGADLPAPTPAPLPTFETGDLLYRSGDLAGALESYEQYLKSERTPADGDRVLFLVAVLRMKPGTRFADPAAAKRHLERLVDRYPDSLYTVAAQTLLRLQDESARLSHQLEELKNIDLGEKPPS